jgi:hypothetical protein
MSEDTMTPESGSGEELTVRSAAAAFEGILSAAEDSPEQPEAEVTETEDVAEEEVSDGEEEVVTDDTDSQEDDTEEVVEDDGEDDEVSDDEPETVTYKIKAAGEEKEVTVDELIKNYQLGADYTKKTQEIAEQRKAIEAEAAAVKQASEVRDLYLQRLQMVEGFLTQQNAGESPQELAEMKENDPVGYAVKMAELTERKENLKSLQLEQQRLAAEQQAERNKTISARLADEAQKLSQILPEFSDPNKGEQLRNEIRAYGKSVGFTDAEMSNVIDHRHVLMLRKAQLYDQLQKNKPNVTKKVNSAPKMVKSGNKVDPSNRDVRKRSMAKLKQTGKVRDAVALFENFI